MKSSGCGSVAQWTEKSLPTQEVCGSNSPLLSLHRKDGNEEKGPNGPTFDLFIF